MDEGYIQRQVNLEPRDYRVVNLFALEKGLGPRSFSAALRLIIREWAERCWKRPWEADPDDEEDNGNSDAKATSEV